jgi:hypothetical protein
LARKLKISAGGIAATADLNDSRTADAIWKALPIEAPILATYSRARLAKMPATAVKPEKRAKTATPNSSRGSRLTRSA